MEFSLAEIIIKSFIIISTTIVLWHSGKKNPTNKELSEMIFCSFLALALLSVFFLS